MEIHSSSLYIAPSPQGTVHPAEVAESDKERSKTDNPPERPLSTPEQFASAAKQQLANAHNQPAPLDIRTAKALDTYTSTLNQLPQQQIAATITGVDFYA